jgi:hypothetical protein
MDHNPFGAIIGGIIGAVAGAILWAAVTLFFSHELGFAAIAIGFITGFLVRVLGKGTTSIYGVIGALFTIVGCTLGKLFTVIILQAQENNISITEALKSFDLSATLPLVKYTFNNYDLLFYLFALLTGYLYSINKPKKMHFRRR